MQDWILNKSPVRLSKGIKSEGIANAQMVGSALSGVFEIARELFNGLLSNDY